MGLFIATVATAYVLTPKPAGSGNVVGLDFIAFYTGGTFVREGRSQDLYDIRAVQQFQRELGHRNGVELGNAVGPWWNPPFYAWVFEPLSALSYRHALRAWWAINLCCAAVAAAMLCRIVATAGPARARQAATWALVPVLMVLSVPFIHALSHGQNTCTSLLILTLTVAAWRARRGFTAGLTGGLLFYKPQLAAVIATILVIDLGWRALAGLGITGAVLLLVTLITLPGSFTQFLYRMPANLHFVQTDVPYLWDRHVTFKAFFRLMLQGWKAGNPTLAVNVLSFLCMAPVGYALVRSAVLLRWRQFSRKEALAAPGSAPRDRLIAATIASTPLLMPFYFDYDQLLMAVPAVLLAADFIRRRAVRLPAADRFLVAAWCVYYPWLMINPDVAGRTRLNLTVPLLATVASLLIARVTRADAAIDAAARSETDERVLAAAA